MGKEIIDPFIKSIKRAFNTIAKVMPNHSKPKQVDLSSFNTEHDYYSDIAAVIALPGTKIGSLVVAFEKDTATKITATFMLEETNELNDKVSDVIGELANTVAGNITSDLEEMNFERALPNIYKGSDNKLEFPVGFICYSVDFTSDFGPFYLRVSILEDENL